METPNNEDYPDVIICKSYEGCGLALGTSIQCCDDRCKVKRDVFERFTIYTLYDENTDEVEEYIAVCNEEDSLEMLQYITTHYKVDKYYRTYEGATCLEDNKIERACEELHIRCSILSKPFGLVEKYAEDQAITDYNMKTYETRTREESHGFYCMKHTQDINYCRKEGYCIYTLAYNNGRNIKKLFDIRRGDMILAKDWDVTGASHGTVWIDLNDIEEIYRCKKFQKLKWKTISGDTIRERIWQNK